MIKSLLLAVSGLALGACSYTSSSPFDRYDELPAPAQRQSVGAWDLGDKNCKGAIQNADGKPFWVVDCWIKAGFGHCTHGLPLRKRGPKEYSNQDGEIVFTIQDDGALEETNRGKLVARYATYDGRICGAAAEKRDEQP